MSPVHRQEHSNSKIMPGLCLQLGETEMKAQELYERGSEELKSAWRRAHESLSPSELGIPDGVALSIAQVMRRDSGVGHLFGLPGQLLLKLTAGLDDSRQTKDLPGIDRASARSFVKHTIVAYEEVGRRLGDSTDPYVSNPMRRSRLGDELMEGSDGEIWTRIFAVLAHADERPDKTHDLLVLALSHVIGWPLQELAPNTPTAISTPAGDLGALADSTGAEEDTLFEIIEALESDQPQVVFAGPPGTGKTHTALAIANHLVGGRHRVVQFHASYGYEEFVEGLRPVPDEKSGLRFDLHPGVVRRVAKNLDVTDRYLLVLDEFNRANLPRVLGELLFSLERRNEPVDLLYSEGFTLPPGLLFVATMNTADRSTRSIDAAVRRRFQFFDFAPSASALERYYEGHPNEVQDLISGFNRLNELLVELLDRHHTVGHTFFMDGRGMTPARLRQVWDRRIYPLLEEYLFDMPEELAALNVSQLWPSIG